MKITTNLLLAGTIATLCAMMMTGVSVSHAAIVGPYANDVYTLHLWHFDETGATPPNAPTNALAFDVSTNLQTSPITLSNTPGPVSEPGFSGYPPTQFALQGQPAYAPANDPLVNFGHCVATTNLSCLISPWTQPAAGVTSVHFGYGTTNVSDFINTNSGAFTFEAMICPLVNPLAAPAKMDLIDGDNGLSNTNRGWAFRITTAGQLEFDSTPGGPTKWTNDVFATLPGGTNADAAAAGNWYHVAITYTGDHPTNGDPAKLLSFYWTLMDPTRTHDDLLFQTNMTCGITNAEYPFLAVGGNTRGSPINNVADAEGFDGYIDEVRISDICRSSNGVAIGANGLAAPGMMFDTNVVVLPPVISILPAQTNQLVGFDQTLAIAATETGSPAITNQWFQNGVALTGQTSATLAIANVTFAAAGNYQLFATNAAGSASSVVCSVTVGAAFNDFFNSGVDADGNVLGPASAGAVDLHYQLIQSAYGPNAGPNAIVLGGPPNSSADGNDTASGWIGPAPLSAGNLDNGTYSYETQFQIDNTVVSNATLSGSILACGPNGGDKMQFVLNGVTNAVVMSATPLKIPATFTFTTTNGLQAGANTLIITMDADSGTSDNNVGCFRLEMTGIGPALTNAPVIVGQPASTTNVYGNPVTFSVVALGEPPLFYQWYSNGIALPATVPGGNTSILTLSTNNDDPAPVGASTYQVVVSNYLGSVTSVVATLTMNVIPVLSNLPIPYTNLFTLYAGADPTFSVSVSGSPPPLFYLWFTNGVLDAAATTNTLQLTNVSEGFLTNDCIVTNLYGVASTSEVWTAQVIADPTNSSGGLAPYPQAVLADQPVAFWRLNEPDDNLGDGNPGVIAHDYQSGNDGIYTNVFLGNTGYNPADPSETSAFFGNNGQDNCYVGQIEGVDFATPTGSNAEFTVEAWAQGFATDSGAPVVSQGIYGASDAFGLGADTSSQRDYQFYVRSAAGTVYTADYTDTTVYAEDGNWHHLVGVCDEANGKVSLYIDGQLSASTSIPANSGEYEANAPMAIGAGTQNNASGYNIQFFGYIDDVSVYKYALSALQVQEQYATVGPAAPDLLAPVPPTNVVFAANSTLTIPATAFGTAPIGYYWTNLTTDTVLGSGATNALQALNASLIIPNASGNLSGDQLELIVTNAVGSTNWFVSLFVPPPPVTLNYSNSILYSNSFVGGTETIAGTAATAANSLVGGTNTLWICTFTNDAASSNGTVYANGTLGTNDGCALVPFTPEPGYIYTMTASLTASESMYNWVAMGFTEFDTQTNNPGFARFSDNPPNGYGWMYVENSDATFEPGPRTTVASSSINTVPLPGSAPVTLQIVLNTVTNGAWTASASVNGVGVGTNAYGTNPQISYAGIGQNQFAVSPPTGIQWNYWSLSAVAPGGVPPYLLAPLPPTNVVLTNTTLTIPATAYGSAPLGYYWSNQTTSTVLESGATNNLSPLNATLIVPNVPASWAGNQLELTVTNAYGTNVTLITLVSPVNPNPTNIVATVTNNYLYLSWPADHIGWQLQAQTNGVNVGLSTNWADYNPSTGSSTTTNQVVIPINLTNGTVFYRLKY